MQAVVHLFDSTLDPSGRRTLALLRAAGGHVVRVGPEDGRTDLPPAELMLRRGVFTGSACSPEVGAAARSFGAAVVHCWCANLADAAARVAPTFVSIFGEPPAGTWRALRHAVRLGATLLAGSAMLRDGLLARGVPPGAVELVEPAAEAPDTGPDARRQARVALGLAPEALVLWHPLQDLTGQAGRLAVWGMGITRQAVATARLIAPDAPGVQRVRRMVRQNQFEAETLYVNPARESAAAAAADVALLTRRDGLALSALAAAVQARVPVVAADAGDLRAILRDGQTALLVQPGSPSRLSRAIYRLHAEPLLRARLAQAAWDELHQRLGQDRMVAQLEGLYARRAQTAHTCAGG